MLSVFLASKAKLEYWKRRLIRKQTSGCQQRNSLRYTPTIPFGRLPYPCSLTRMFQTVTSCSFQGIAASKVKLTTAHGRLFRSWKVSLTPSQMHLRINNHRAHKFPPSLVLHSCKARTEWPPTFRCRPQPQVWSFWFTISIATLIHSDYSFLQH